MCGSLFASKDVITHEDDRVEDVDDRCRVQWSAVSLDIVACVEVVGLFGLFPLVHREEFRGKVHKFLGQLVAWWWQLINAGVEDHFSVNRKGVRLVQVQHNGERAGLGIIYGIMVRTEE